MLLELYLTFVTFQTLTVPFGRVPFRFSQVFILGELNFPPSERFEFPWPRSRVRHHLDENSAWFGPVHRDTARWVPGSREN